MYAKYVSAFPKSNFTFFGFTRNFEATPKNPLFYIFSSCTQTKDNFWKIYHAFLTLASGGGVDATPHEFF